MEYSRGVTSRAATGAVTSSPALEALVLWPRRGLTVRPGIVHDDLSCRLIRQVIHAITTRNFAFPRAVVHRPSQGKNTAWIARCGTLAKVFVPPQGILRGTIDQRFPVTVHAAVPGHNQPSPEAFQCILWRFCQRFLRGIDCSLGHSRVVVARTGSVKGTSLATASNAALTSWLRTAQALSCHS